MRARLIQVRPSLINTLKSNPRKGASLQSDGTAQKREGEMEKWRELDGQNRKVINFIGYKPGTGDMIVAKPSYSSSPQSDGTVQKRDGEMERIRWSEPESH